MESGNAGVLIVYTIDGKELVRYSVNEGTTRMRLPKQIAHGVYMCRFAGADGSTMMVRLVVE